MAVEQKLGRFRCLGHPKTRPQLWPSDQGAQDRHWGAASPSYSFTWCSWLLDNPCSLGSSFFPSWERGRIRFSTVFSPGCPLKCQGCLMATDLRQLETVSVTQKAFFHAIQSMFVPCRNHHQGKDLSLGDINPTGLHRSHKGNSQLFPTAALFAYPDLQLQVTLGMFAMFCSIPAKIPSLTYAHLFLKTLPAGPFPTRKGIADE